MRVVQSCSLVVALFVVTSCAEDAGRAQAEAGSDTAGGATSACDVQGVWELVSTTVNGAAEPLNGRQQRKIVSARHFIWVSQAARRDTLPLRTPVDSLRVVLMGAGAGTYTLRDSTYTENIEFFNNPTFIGRPWTATCQTQNDVWRHKFVVPDSAGREAGTVVVEEWRRVE